MNLSIYLYFLYFYIIFIFLYFFTIHYYWLDWLLWLVTLDKYDREFPSDRRKGESPASHGFLTGLLLPGVESQCRIEQ